MLLIEIKKKRIKKTERKKSGCKKSNCLLIVQMSASQKQQSKGGGGRGIVNGVRIENGDTSGRCLSTRLCRVVRSRQPEGSRKIKGRWDFIKSWKSKVKTRSTTTSTLCKTSNQILKIMKNKKRKHWHLKNWGFLFGRK